MESTLLTMLVINLVWALLGAVAVVVIVQKAGFSFWFWGCAGLGLLAFQFDSGVMPWVRLLLDSPSGPNNPDLHDTYYVVASHHYIQNAISTLALAAFAFARWPALYASSPSTPPKGQA